MLIIHVCYNSRHWSTLQCCQTHSSQGNVLHTLLAVTNSMCINSVQSLENADYCWLPANAVPMSREFHENLGRGPQEVGGCPRLPALPASIPIVPGFCTGPPPPRASLSLKCLVTWVKLTTGSQRFCISRSSSRTKTVSVPC